MTAIAEDSRPVDPEIGGMTFVSRARRGSMRS